MADKRAFAKFDVGYLDNPKMMDVLDASSNAIIMHFASVLYCAQHLTDGVIASKAMQRKAGGQNEDTQILLDAGLWHGENHDCASCPQPPVGKVYVHDFLQHNRDSEQAKGLSKTRSKSATLGWEKRKAAEQDAMQNALQTDDVCNAEREREKEITTTSEPDGSDKEIPVRSDVQEIIDYMSAALERNGVRFKVGKSWYAEGRRLIDIDKYTVEQIKFVIRYATTDGFWKTNIMSMPTLRAKFEQLKLKAQAASNQAAAPAQVASQHGWAN